MHTIGLLGLGLSPVAQAVQQAISETRLQIDGFDLLIDGYPIVFN
jgi:hypothetical protein